MKALLLLLCAALPVVAQPAEGTDFIDMGADFVPSYVHTFTAGPILQSTLQYSWSITRASNGDKQFTFTAKRCTYEVDVPDPLAPGTAIWLTLPLPFCTNLTESQAETLGPIAAALTEFYNYHPNAPHDPPIYNPPPPTDFGFPSGDSLKPLRPADLTTATPIAAPDPQMIFLDGFSQNLLAYDLTTNQITSTVVVPSTTGPLGVRPVATGAPHEVWTANGGAQVTVADLSTQSVVTNIAFSSLPQAAVPAGIVFTPDGATAFEAIGFSSPDANGNSGALVVLDVVNRKVASIFPLKLGPTAIVIAPDGYTVYLLSSNGYITYYDVLSGTADLSLSTFTPGLAGGYSGPGGVFIAPNGTELYWNVGYLLVTFNLTTHKISSVVNTGLPSTSASTLSMAQDGSTLWLTNAAGNIAIYDPRTGVLYPTLSVTAGSAMYPGVSQ